MTAKNDINLLKKRIAARTAKMTEAAIIEGLRKTAAMYADFMNKYGPQHEGYARWAEGLDRHNKRMASSAYITLSLAKLQALNEVDTLTIKILKMDAV